MLLPTREKVTKQKKSDEKISNLSLFYAIFGEIKYVYVVCKIGKIDIGIYRYKKNK